KIYLLDLEEIAKYEAVLGNIVEKTSWLRSSGGLQSAVSVFDGKNVNHYGRLATEHVIYAYPIFWYSIK
ncbi:hypothetical protein, partial [Anaerosporobacter sp.]|uniref:hypothetical protein n=1 Tax=Anaerosporobacter sp. TaxID=1872529 RepID=UPI00286F080B